MEKQSHDQRSRHEILDKLQLLKKRFRRGLSISAEDLALLGWLHHYEQSSGAQGIPGHELKWLIPEGAAHLGIDTSTMQPAQIVQRLVRLGLLRMSIAESTRSAYRLTCLGQSIVRSLLDDIDYSPEQLNILLDCALKELTLAASESFESIHSYLRYVFLGPIREKIEHKLLSIDEDLGKRKKEVKRTYSASDQEEFDRAIGDIEYCRLALTEMVEAVEESSAFVRLEEMFHEWMGEEQDGGLYRLLEESMDFLYLIRMRIDSMLKDVVQFIRDCAAYRNFAITLDARDQLCRIQELILTHALHHNLRMPLVGIPRLPRLDLRWSKQEQESASLLEREKLISIENFFPPELPPVEPEWKKTFIHLARDEWGVLSRNGRVDLAGLVRGLAEKLPQLAESPCLALWYLSQDWSQWVPGVSIEHCRGEWVPLGNDWMMEAVLLNPVEQPAREAAPGETERNRAPQDVTE